MKYVNELIIYMKVQDTTDIFQSDYPPKSPKNVEELKDDESNSSGEIMNEANKLMMKELDAELPTMDDYVTKKIIKVKEPTPPPTRREANINTIEHKTKGLKKKAKKKKKEDANQSAD